MLSPRSEFQQIVAQMLAAEAGPREPALLQGRDAQDVAAYVSKVAGRQ